MIFFVLILLAISLLCVAQECINRKCRNNDCLANEYQDMQCTNGTKKCCDKSCTYSSVASCGAPSVGCVIITTRTVTTPAGKYRTDGCANNVVVSNTPCSTNCADCVETWSSWGACSVSCGGNGSQSRLRTTVSAPVGPGRACSVVNSQARTLCIPAPPPCPIPCVPGPWSQWSPCNGICSPALRQRVRNAVVPAQFGGSCDALNEVVMCTELPPCEGSTVVTTPFPTPVTLATSPTMPPLTLPTGLATFLIFNDQLTSKVDFEDKPISLVLPNALGSLVAVVMNSTTGTQTESPFLTSALQSLGCQIPGTNVNAGEILAPAALRFLFDSPRAFARVVLAGVSDGESALLVGFDRDARKRTSEIVIELRSSDQSFGDNVGFDTWELRPAAGSSVGLQTIEVFAAVAALPTPATTTPPLDVSGDTTTGGESDSDALNSPDVATPAGDDQTSLIIALCVAFALLAVACLFVWWVVRRRNREREHEAVRHFSDPNAFAALQNNNSIGSYGKVGLRPHYEHVGELLPGSEASDQTQDVPAALPSAYAHVPALQSSQLGAVEQSGYNSARYESFHGPPPAIDQAAKVGYRDFLLPTPAAAAALGTQYGVGDLTHEVAADRVSYSNAPNL
jgi:hypothetical protein